MPRDTGRSTPIVTIPGGQATRRAPSYRLTVDLIAEHGGEVICLSPRADGKAYRLFPARPDASRNERLSRVEADIIEKPEDEKEEPETVVSRVDIQGPLEQRSGVYEPCGAWTDGHDAVTERMLEALEVGNVIMVIDSPGGAYAGLEEGIRRVLEEKEKHGRHVIAYADEMIASAAYWWAACVADEIYGPSSMLVGSIGARSAHASIAGALEKEGVKVTYFSWPPGDGKVAFAPEMPLSEIGKERGNRDVTLCGEAFAAAIGPRRGISRKEIVDLNADCLSGALALEAKLVDGIASLEDVTQYALALASTPIGDDDMDPKTALVRPGITRTEEEDPNKEKTPEAEEDKTPPEPADKAECKACGAANDDDAKYCDKCGEPMAGTEAEEDGPKDGEDKDKEARAAGDGDHDSPEDEGRAEAPPDDKDKDKEARAARAARSGSLASILGLKESASHPQIKSAVLSLVSLGRKVLAATGMRTVSEAEGALQTIVDDAADVQKLRTELAASLKRESRRERMDLLMKLAAKNIPGYTRGELFTDREVGGKLVMGPSAVYEEMKLSTLRGLVSSKLSGAAGKVTSRSPFEPDSRVAKEAATKAKIDNAVSTKFIQGIASRSSASAEQLARTAAALEAQGAQQ